MVRRLLDTQRAALDAVRAAGDPVLELYRLRAPYVSLTALELLDANRPVQADLAGVTTLWKELGAPYVTHASEAAAPAVASPVVRALHQSARNRAEKLYRAALPYAKADTPLSGLYQLGEAEGERRFSELVLAFADLGPVAGEQAPRGRAA
jgi:hypothetical protein